MSTASVLLGFESAGGHFIQDPRDLDRYAVKTLYFSTGIGIALANGMLGAHATNLWTTQAAFGASLVTTAWVANTYKTVIDVAGRGFLEQVIGPQITVNATSTIRITTDGVAREIQMTNFQGAWDDVPRRQILGAIGMSASYATLDDTLTEADVIDMSFPTQMPNGHLADGPTTGNQYAYLLKRNRLLELGQILKYSDGLKVEIKTSAVIATGTSELAHYAGARHRTAN